jgi:hypothetical protein
VSCVKGRLTNEGNIIAYNIMKGTVLLLKKGGLVQADSGLSITQPTLGHKVMRCVCTREEFKHVQREAPAIKETTR